MSAAVASNGSSAAPSPTASSSGSASTPVSSVADARSGIPPPVCPPPLPHEAVNTWAFLRDATLTNRLGTLRRTPSQAETYDRWLALVRASYGSPGNYLIRERLKWTPVDAAGSPGGLRFEVKSSVPLQDEDDYTILKNDWPYGLDKGIFHICVWSKARLECVGPRGALTREGWDLVDQFVTKTFLKPMLESEKGAEEPSSVVEEVDESGDWNLNWDVCTNAGGDGERLIWFKNWIELQSVPGLDHIHVLIKDPAPELIKRWIK